MNIWKCKFYSFVGLNMHENERRNEYGSGKWSDYLPFSLSFFSSCLVHLKQGVGRMDGSLIDQLVTFSGM